VEEEPQLEYAVSQVIEPKNGSYLPQSRKGRKEI